MLHRLSTSVLAFLVATTGLAPAARAADAPVIGLAVANLQADFFNQIKQSASAEAAARGVRLLVVDAHGDSATQVNQIQDLITRNVKAIIYIPAGATAAGVPVRSAKQANIPVVAVDRNPPDAPATTFIASDSVAGAKALGDFVCKQTGGTGVLAVIQGQIGTTPEQDRAKGFQMALSHCPNVRTIAQQASQEWSQSEGFSIGQDMLQRHPEITVFFGRADALALGAAQAVKVANLDHKVIVVGFDGDTAGLKAVAKGTLSATMTQKTQYMGKLAVDSALDLANGKKLPAQQLQEAVLTTKDNVSPFIANHP